MIVPEVILHGNLEGDMEKFGAQAPKLVDKTIRIVAYRYRSHIKKDYLSGQMLNGGDYKGGLKDSLVAGKKKGKKFVYLVGSKKKTNKKTGEVYATALKLANIYEHPGGYTIKPKNKKALRFESPNVAGPGAYVFVRGEIHGGQRPFMSDSVRSFPWSAEFAKTTEEVIVKEMKKLEKQGAYVPGGLD